MRRLRRVAGPGDSGQAFPIYITAVAGLLFLGLALFAVGQAGVTRNGAQTAADAAALAAAQDHRDALRDELLAAIGSGDAWQDILDGIGTGSPRACDEARWFAAENDADVTDCTVSGGPVPTFHVAVQTRYTVGDSIVPGTESRHAEAEATAEIEPRCVRLPGKPDPTPSPDPRPTDDDADNGDDGEGNDADEGGNGGGDGNDGDDKPEEKPKAPPVEFTCDGEEWSIDPERPDTLPDVTDLFSVHLAD
ncbi:pilus assembly protein TadG-related protein [Streptomyces sp. 71268]|uniref:pilus assembly protein TadG-related protein n=1 Tax=Streptomyces sp. 71268 TaxID=3002640 RepID=UPI0023F7F8BF|nr:pilus assembly protein TadG-related protein [Streptomyces sp. 71268]WEV25695.1 pilus assembly protein TadG-related protein [Streptomyces sp. 71268]